MIDDDYLIYLIDIDSITYRPIPDGYFPTTYEYAPSNNLIQY